MSYNICFVVASLSLQYVLYIACFADNPHKSYVDNITDEYNVTDVNWCFFIAMLCYNVLSLS